jgi:D-glycero-alpha-D-manno-heptose 1-phosphate guanylyltransferase
MSEAKFSEIDVVILCGGRGERLKKVVSDRPKPMADMGGKPFLDMLMGYLQKSGFCRFILCAGYKGRMIKDHYAAKHDSREILTLLESKPLGTGGAIKNAESAVKSSPFLAVNGDSFCPVDYRSFIEFHRDKKALYSMALVKLPENQDGGLVCVDENWKVKGFNEKARSEKAGYINAGVYLLDRKIFDAIKGGEKTSLEHDIFPRLIGEKFYGYAAGDRLTDIGTPDRYARAREDLNNAV